MKKFFLPIIPFVIILSVSMFAIGSDLSIIEHGVDLGKVFKGSFKVMTDKKAIEIRVHDWSIDLAGNSVILYNKKLSGSWLKIPQLIEKKKRSDDFIIVPYTINITSTEKSEQIAKILVSEISGPSKENIDIALELGIPLYAWLKDAPKFGFDIEQATYDSHKKMISATAKNKGNVHIRPSISMEIHAKKRVLDI